MRTLPSGAVPDEEAIVNLDIPGPAGRIEALLDEPPQAPRAAAVFAHPLPTKGGTMHTKAVFQSAKALARIGCAVLRFNFRGVGRSEGSFDEGRGELNDYAAAVEYMTQRYKGLPVWAGGFSFGGWIAVTKGMSDPRVELLLAVSLPASRYDLSAVERSTLPKFLIHGERDEICPLPALWRFYARLAEPKELVVIDGADHLFEGKVSEVGDAIEDLLGDYVPAQPSVRNEGTHNV
jgi:alpha/beta superfamily hydrolase